MKFKIGDIVRISKKSGYYGFGENNPKDIDGEIIEFYESVELGIQVSWGNNSQNGYGESDLKLKRRP